MKMYECDICKDDGLCLNNTKNPNYDGDFFGSDIYDCVEYLEVKKEVKFLKNKKGQQYLFLS